MHMKYLKKRRMYNIKNCVIVGKLIFKIKWCKFETEFIREN